MNPFAAYLQKHWPRLLVLAHRIKHTRRFLQVHLDTVNMCNLRCEMCYYSRMEGKEPLIAWDKARFMAVATRVFPHVHTLFLSCATEPFMNPEMAAFIKISKKLFHVPTINLVTNGTMMKPSISSKIVHSGLDNLFVSLDAARAETYESIRRPAKFDKVLENLQALKKAKQENKSTAPRLTLNYILMKRNVEEAEAFIDLARSLGAEAVIFSHLLLYDNVDLAHERLKEKDVDQVKLVDRLSAKCERYGIELQVAPGRGEQFENCHLPFGTVFLSHAGDVRPCGPWTGKTLGNVFQEDFWDIWHSDAYQELRETVNSDQRLEPCQHCPNRMLFRSDTMQPLTFGARHSEEGKA